MVVLFLAMKNVNTEIKTRQVHPTDKEVLVLIAKLDAYQIGLYGEMSCHLDSIEELSKDHVYMVGIYTEEKLRGIGALKFFDDYAELKRFYVNENYRGLGIAEQIIKHLEKYAMTKGITRICLETGIAQQSALKFYQKHQYYQIETYGNNQPNDVSVYMEKYIIK